MANNKQRQAILVQEIGEQYEVYTRYSGIQSGVIEDKHNSSPEFIEKVIVDSRAKIEMLCFALRMFVKTVDEDKYPWAWLFDWHSKGKKALAMIEIEMGNAHYQAFL